MATYQIINNHLQGGTWRADLIGAGQAQPDLRADCAGAEVPIEMTHNATRDVWQLTLSLPRAMLSDGTQACVIRDGAGEVLASMTVVAGKPAVDDLMAEVALLRAELDLLKAAFRDSQQG